MSETDRAAANRTAYERLCDAEPVLVDLGPAIRHLPGMGRETILTSGPALPFAEYEGGQRDAIIGAAQFEGLAADAEEAVAMLEGGRLRIGGCHDYGAVGSLAGVYTASMPVFAVRNETGGNFGYCNFYEGTDPRRLNYGVYDEGVKERLLFVQDVVAPVIAEAVRRAGGIRLKSLMQRALHMGDELHSRNTAAALLFLREIALDVIDMAGEDSAEVKQAVEALTADHYFFLRLSMAAAKATADAAHGIEGSSVVTAMGFSCREFAIRVSGLGDQWFTGPHAQVQAKLFEGHDESEITWMGGGESDRRNHRAGRLRPGGGLPPPALPGRIGGGDGRAQPRALRDHGGGEQPLSHPLPRLPRQPHRHRPVQGCWTPECCPRWTSVWRAGTAGRSAPVSCVRRWSVSSVRPRRGARVTARRSRGARIE